MKKGGRPAGHRPGGGEPLGTYHRALRGVGLLSGPDLPERCQAWLQNALRRQVAPGVIAGIAGQHQIGPDGFAVLEDMVELTDPDGKSYFLVAAGASGDDGTPFRKK